MYGCGEIALNNYENEMDRLYREKDRKEIKKLSDKELEQLIYEYTHEIHDRRFRERLLEERKRRNLEQWMFMKNCNKQE